MQTLDFDWDPEKARRNMLKHGVAFDEATTVLADPLALTLFDEDHSDQEDRWITLGSTTTGRLLVVVHTFDERGNRAYVRIVSARSATGREQRQYREGLPT